jgi:hypothetical protein
MRSRLCIIATIAFADCPENLSLWLNPIQEICQNCMINLLIILLCGPPGQARLTHKMGTLLRKAREIIAKE